MRLQVDPRAVAALRIACAAWIALDLLLRWPDIVVFYTDAGAFPRAMARATFPTLSTISVHMWSGAAWFQHALFALQMVLAVAWGFGFHVRRIGAAVLVLHASLLLRNPIVLNTGDSLVLLVTFWLLFLPHVPWTLVPDARGSRIAEVGLLALPVLIYVTNLVFKLRVDVWRSGEALNIVFASERMTTELGHVFSAFDLRLAAYGWLLMLALSPMLLVATGRTRIVLVGAFMLAHGSMFVLMRIGLFPLASMALLMAFLPPMFWNRWTRFDLPRPEIGWKDALPSAALAILLLWSIVSLGVVPTPDNELVEQHGHGWAMFANPHRQDVWHTFPTEDGDALFGQRQDPARLIEPSPYPDFRWRKFMYDIGGQRNLNPVPLANYLCGVSDAQEVTVLRAHRPIGGNVTVRPVLSHAC